MKPIQLKKEFLAGKLPKAQFIRRMHVSHARLFDYMSLLSDSGLAKLEITDQGIVAETRGSGIQMFCDEEDQRIIPFEILNFGSFEARELEMLAELCQGKKTFFDIGANVGWYSLNLAKRFPELQILAFEPIPKTYRSLTANVRLNKASNIQIYNHGFSDQNGELTFFYNPAWSGSASGARLTNSRKTEKIICRVQTLDNFAKRKKVKIDVIKCDVEGAELLVLNGGREMLKRDRPVIFLEMLRKWSAAFGYHPNDIIKMLTEFGYQCFTCRNGDLKRFSKVQESTTETNYFFIPRR